MITSMVTDEKLAYWKRLWEEGRKDFRPNRIDGRKLNEYFVGRYGPEKIEDGSFADAVRFNAIEQYGDMDTDIACYRVDDICVGIELNSGFFHVEGEDIDKCGPIYDDLLVRRGLNEEDLGNYVITGQYLELAGRKRTFYTADRNEWRKWLAEHYMSEPEIWFVFPLKASGEPALSYNDAVEEALCFGWIDTTAGKLDDMHGIRRFCPRKNGAYYSRPNIERLIWLDERGLIMPEVREAVASFIETPYVFPEDILDEIRRDELAWENYQGFSEAYRRIRVAYIDAARKRPEEFKKRLRSFIKKTHDGKLIVGYGGVDKYYK